MTEETAPTGAVQQQEQRVTRPMTQLQHRGKLITATQLAAATTRRVQGANNPGFKKRVPFTFTDWAAL